MNTMTSQNTTPVQSILLIVLAVIFPPIPVFLLHNYKVLTKPMLVTVILTIAGHLPGVIFAIYYVLNFHYTAPRLDPEISAGSEAGLLDGFSDSVIDSVTDTGYSEGLPKYTDLVERDVADNKIQK